MPAQLRENSAVTKELENPKRSNKNAQTAQLLISHANKNAKILKARLQLMREAVFETRRRTRDKLPKSLDHGNRGFQKNI